MIYTIKEYLDFIERTKSEDYPKKWIIGGRELDVVYLAYRILFYYDGNMVIEHRLGQLFTSANDVRLLLAVAQLEIYLMEF